MDLHSPDAEAWQINLHAELSWAKISKPYMYIQLFMILGTVYDLDHKSENQTYVASNLRLNEFATP